MPRILVTGVDQFLGANLAVALAGRFDVVGVRRVDDGLKQKPRADWVIHCGALSNSSWSDANLQDALAEERRAARHLASMVRGCGCRLTVISTDAVFDGPWMFHDEQSAQTRRRSGVCEIRQLERQYLQAGAMVVRSHVFGWGFGIANFAEQLWNDLRDGVPVAASAERFASPILATDLAPLLAEAWRRGLAGLLHLGGAERVSQRRFAAEMARAFGWPDEFRTREHWTSAPPRETALDSRRAVQLLARPLPLLRAAMERFALQRTDGHRQQLLALDLRRAA